MMKGHVSNTNKTNKKLNKNKNITPVTQWQETLVKNLMHKEIHPRDKLNKNYERYFIVKLNVQPRVLIIG